MRDLISSYPTGKFVSLCCTVQFMCKETNASAGLLRILVVHNLLYRCVIELL